MQDPLFDFESGSPLTSMASPSSQPSHFKEIILNGSKMFSCQAPDCGKTFKYKSEMTRHVAIHLDQRPYVCSYPGCSKTFKRNDALINHFRVHNKKAAYDCPVAGCKSEFTTKSALRYHLLKHEGQKTFECGYSECNQTFQSQSQLEHHEKNVCCQSDSKQESLLQTVCSPSTQQSPNILDQVEEIKVQDYSTLTAGNMFAGFEFPEFDVKFGELMTVENESDGCSLPSTYNSAVSKNEEVLSTDMSEISSLGKKSGRNLEDILISLLTYMTEENQQLKKKLKYSTDTLVKENLVEVNQPQTQSYSDEHDYFLNQNQDLDIDSFFRSPLRFEGDEDNEKEFTF